MTDRERLLQTLVAVYAYYDRELSEFAISVWLEDLEEHPVDAVCEAFKRHRRDPERGQWLPKSADILRQLQGDKAEAVQLAWARLLLQVRTLGSYGRPNLDPASRLALDGLGGWGAVCRATERDLAFLQRRFGEAFGAHQARVERGASTTLLGSDFAMPRLQ